MDELLRKRLVKYVRERGDEIQGILPRLEGHRVRQAQAHIWGELRWVFGIPAKEVASNRFAEVISAVDLICKHAAEVDVRKYLIGFEREPMRATLEGFYDED